VDEKFSKAEAVVVSRGKIVATGSSKSLLNRFDAEEKIDAKGKFLFPGFIDAHAHFFGYGLGLQRAKLDDTKSWAEVLSKVKKYADKNKEEWIIGRGWNQNDWQVKEFP